MTYNDYLTYLQGLAKVILTPLMPKTMSRPLTSWWTLLLAHVGISEIVIGTDLGEALTWLELTMVHGYLCDQAYKQSEALGECIFFHLEDAMEQMPKSDGRAVLASPIPTVDLKKEKVKTA